MQLYKNHLPFYNPFMYEFIEIAAQELGFERVYFLAPKRLHAWRKRAEETGFGTDLIENITAHDENVSSIALLIYPYHPYAKGERIPAYYINSNRSYHAAKTLVSTLNNAGVSSEYAVLPYRALAHASNIGAIGQNGLLHVKPYGSRIILHALIIHGLAPRSYDTREFTCPPNCDACARACPSNAITDNGLDIRRCMRAQMEDTMYNDEVKEKLPGHIGCELCMLACPFNASLPVDDPDKTIRDAFDLKRLILGDAAKARVLVGKNMTSNGKLTAEAIVFAAREGLYEKEIRDALFSPFKAVRDAAAWAVRKHF